MTAPSGSMMDPSLEAMQRIERRVYHEIDMPPTPAIAAVGAASWYIFLPAEGYYPVAAVTRFNINFRFIKEHTLHCKGCKAKEQK
jgi:hypothetical protein